MLQKKDIPLKKGMSLQLTHIMRLGYVVVVLAVSPPSVLAGEHAFYFEE